MNEFTLLSDEQTFGPNRIKVIKKLRSKCAISDFAILLGGYVTKHYHVKDDTSLKGRTGCWYLSSPSDDGNVRAANVEGDRDWVYAYERGGSVRPVLPFSNISDISNDVVRGKSGLLEITYGEYPQYVVPSSLGKALDDEFSSGRLRKTGKTYTTDSRQSNAYLESFSPTCHEEFEYNGKKYVRVKSNCHEKGSELSNGIIVYPGDYVWVEVSPIVWYVDKKAKMLVSKILLAAGIRYCNKSQYEGDFKTTEMYMFLNEYFAKDIVQSKLQEVNKSTKKDTKLTSEKQIEEIYEYCKELPNGDEIIKRVDEIIKEYNDKVAEIHKLKKNNIPTMESLFAITNDLELKLNMILDDLKTYHEKYKTYFEMLDALDEYISIVNGDIKENHYDLSVDLNTITNTCIPFLKEKEGNELKEKLLNILNNKREEIANYLNISSIFNDKTNNKELKYNSINELNLELRKQLQPLLEKLNTNVSKRDIELEIKESIAKIINGLYSEPKNKFLSFYLTEINKTYTYINNSLNQLPKDLQKECKEELESIMTEKIDYNKDFNSITSDLRKMWLSLNKVSYKIEKYLDEIEQIENSYIDTSKFKK